MRTGNDTAGTVRPRRAGRPPAVLDVALTTLLAPLLVAAATLAARRLGPRIGGVVSAFPAIVGPVLLIDLLEHGATFTARAAAGTLLGLVALAAFNAVYGLATGRGASWPAPSGSGGWPRGSRSRPHGPRGRPAGRHRRRGRRPGRRRRAARARRRRSKAGATSPMGRHLPMDIGTGRPTAARRRSGRRGRRDPRGGGRGPRAVARAHGADGHLGGPGARARGGGGAGGPVAGGVLAALPILASVLAVFTHRDDGPRGGGAACGGCSAGCGLRRVLPRGRAHGRAGRRGRDVRGRDGGRAGRAGPRGVQGAA
jgi:hypothetical protein